VVGGGVSAISLSSKFPFFYAAGIDGSIFIVALEDGQQFPKQPLIATADAGEIANMPTLHPLLVDDMKLFTDVM